MKSKNKSLIFTGFLILTILGFAVLPQPAYAATFWDGLGIALTKIATGFLDLYFIPLAIILQIIQMITGVLPVVAGEIFRVALNLNDSIALTPASHLAQPYDMVVVGFQFTRDIANMLFILILAWVGFATILRLKAYEIKEIIPKLVMIALLINFIPIITSVILDIASIITRTFTNQATGIGLYMIKLLPIASLAQNANYGILIPGSGGISGMAAASLMGIVFNLIAFFMLSLYAILFIMRIVAIWILIVLAPLAWLGYIIPQGKKMWDMWWKQFIQWAIIGIPLTFFLYLTTFVLSSSSFVCTIDNAEAFKQYGWLEGLLTGLVGQGLICRVLPFLAGIIVMLVGFILSITLSPTGADTVIKQAKKGGLAASKVLGTTAVKSALRTAKAPAEAFKSSQQAWNIHRGLGHSRRQSFGAAMERGWAATRLQTTGELRPKAMVRSASRGTWKAIKDSAKVGWTAGVGGKNKKKGRRTQPCDACNFGSIPGEIIGANAERCPRCGQQF